MAWPTAALLTAAQHMHAGCKRASVASPLINLSPKGWVAPRAAWAVVCRHHVQVRDQQYRIQLRLLAPPGEQQAQVIYLQEGP